MKLGPSSVQNLDIWKEGIELVKEIYLLTNLWPKDEIYGLTSQVKRAVVSIPTNIAEGVGRGSPGEASRFAQIALGSAYELNTLLVVAGELNFSTSDNMLPIQEKLDHLSRRISSYIRYQEGKR